MLLIEKVSSYMLQILITYAFFGGTMKKLATSFILMSLALPSLGFAQKNGVFECGLVEKSLILIDHGLQDDYQTLEHRKMLFVARSQNEVNPVPLKSITFKNDNDSLYEYSATLNSTGSISLALKDTATGKVATNDQVRIDSAYEVYPHVEIKFAQADRGDDVKSVSLVCYSSWN